MLKRVHSCSAYPVPFPAATARERGGCYAFWVNVGKVSEYKCLDSRIMRVKIKLDGEIVVVVSVYGPGIEKKEDERERF